jgi:ribonuclease G
MSKELVISANRHETRVAVLEDDQVVEVFYQRENEYSLAGSIHKGRVTRVLPGMQSAFVDIGLGRDAFLYVSDFFEDNDEYDKIVTSVEEKVLKLDRTPAPVVQALPVEAAAPEAVNAPSMDAVAVPVDVPPSAPLSPPASAMQVPAGFQGNRRPDGRQDRGGDGGRIRGETGVETRAETGAAGARAEAAGNAAADEDCRTPNTIHRGPKGNHGIMCRRW